jgi:hypothetical protein
MADGLAFKQMNFVKLLRAEREGNVGCGRRGGETRGSIATIEEQHWRFVAAGLIPDPGHDVLGR